MAKRGGEAARPLAPAILQFCSLHTHDRGLAPSGRPRFEMGLNMRANVSPRGESNEMRAHLGCLWPAVHYVGDGGDAEAGKLVLHDPRFLTSRIAAPDLVFPADGEPEEMKRKIDKDPGELMRFH